MLGVHKTTLYSFCQKNKVLAYVGQKFYYFTAVMNMVSILYYIYIKFIMLLSIFLIKNTNNIYSKYIAFKSIKNSFS